MIAYDFPLLSVFWVLMVAYFVFGLLFAFVWAFVDNFRRSDHGGLAKAGWTLLLLVFPLFGVLAYLVVRPIEVLDTRRDAVMRDGVAAGMSI